eukprot:CFRG6688T1
MSGNPFNKFVTSLTNERMIERLEQYADQNYQLSLALGRAKQKLRVAEERLHTTQDRLINLQRENSSLKVECLRTKEKNECLQASSLLKKRCLTMTETHLQSILAMIQRGMSADFDGDEAPEDQSTTANVRRDRVRYDTRPHQRVGVEDMHSADESKDVLTELPGDQYEFQNTTHAHNNASFSEEHLPHSPTRTPKSPHRGATKTNTLGRRYGQDKSLTAQKGPMGGDDGGGNGAVESGSGSDSGSPNSSTEMRLDVFFDGRCEVNQSLEDLEKESETDANATTSTMLDDKVYGRERPSASASACVYTTTREGRYNSSDGVISNVSQRQKKPNNGSNSSSKRRQSSDFTPRDRSATLVDLPVNLEEAQVAHSPSPSPSSSPPLTPVMSSSETSYEDECVENALIHGSHLSESEPTLQNESTSECKSIENAYPGMQTDTYAQVFTSESQPHSQPECKGEVDVAVEMYKVSVNDVTANAKKSVREQCPPTDDRIDGIVDDIIEKETRNSHFSIESAVEGVRRGSLRVADDLILQSSSSSENASWRATMHANVNDDQNVSTTVTVDGNDIENMESPVQRVLDLSERLALRKEQRRRSSNPERKPRPQTVQDTRVNKKKNASELDTVRAVPAPKPRVNDKSHPLPSSSPTAKPMRKETPPPSPHSYHQTDAAGRRPRRSVAKRKSYIEPPLNKKLRRGMEHTFGTPPKSPSGKPSQRAHTVANKRVSGESDENCIPTTGVCASNVFPHKQEKVKHVATKGQQRGGLTSRPPLGSINIQNIR